MRPLVIAALLAFPAPAFAQAGERVLTIFGEDRCPENTICVRAPETERFRIPKNLRENPVIAPNRQSWAARAQSVTDAGARTGTMSCSAVGPGGNTGCYAQQMAQAKAEREQAKLESATGLEDDD